MTPTAEPVLVMVDGIGAQSPIALRLTHVNATSLSLHPLDLGISRGDGVFESIGVINGHPVELEAHLKRLARSAEMLELPALRFRELADAVLYAISRHTRVFELLVKIFITRGTEHQLEPKAWIYAAEGPDYSKSRKEGISVVTLNRGYPRNIAQTSPWLLQGAKTLSYAVNQAALREAKRRGAEDIIYISSDGYVLEGPTSTVILRDSYGYRTPPAEDGVLPGTTQARIFKGLKALGHSVKMESLREDNLHEAEALWMVSSGRLVAPVNTLNEVIVPIDHDITSQMLEILRRQSTLT